MIAGTADAPERYRVLVPFTVEGFRHLTGTTPANAWHLTRLTLFFVGFATFFVYLRTWFSDTLALLGTSIVAGTWPLTLTNSWAHPDHVAELALFTAGCLAIARTSPGEKYQAPDGSWQTRTSAPPQRDSRCPA